jgi:NADH-quinone oxidoreductase subunit F
MIQGRPPVNSNQHSIGSLIDPSRPIHEQLSAALQKIQDEHNYLPLNLLRELSRTTGISMAHITGFATFYPSYRLQPAGRHLIQVCTGTACHVQGAEAVYDSLKRHLQIPENHDTDKERLFTIERAACLGCCTLAPAVQIDSTIYGHCTPENSDTIINEFLENAGNDPGESFVNREDGEIGIKTCLCTSCRASGSATLYSHLQRMIKKRKLPVSLSETSCTGMASFTPMLEVTDIHGHVRRHGPVTLESVTTLLDEMISGLSTGAKIGAIWRSLVHGIAGTSPGNIPPETEQMDTSTDIVLETRGRFDPLDIDEWINHGGFSSLADCLKTVDKQQIIDQIKESRIRGRGGAGFPSWRKWQALHDSDSGTRYLVCNGDEGDPGAFMDRLLMESFPFRVIEGLLIAASTLLVEHAYIYIRSEYPMARERMERAINQCREKKILGTNIHGSGWSCDITVICGAGAFVCGEETALIQAIQGNRGTPRIRPPYPVESGLYGRPTIVHNVETLASLPWIFRHGSAAFQKIGTGSSSGTKTLALAGKIRNGGLIEVPMGITLRSIIYEKGGGIIDDARLKGVLIGGPSGGCLPAEHIDQPVTYESLVEFGAIMGSGGLVVLDEHDCMVDLARYFMQFTAEQSCGKCTACRVGTVHMVQILERFCAGSADDRDLELLEETAGMLKSGSQCGLGKTAPNPVLTTLRWFRQEYKDHMKGKCSSLSCKNLVHYEVNDACIGCTKCRQSCPVDAVAGIPHERHQIDVDTCIRCGACKRVCPSSAVEVIS